MIIFSRIPISDFEEFESLIENFPISGYGLRVFLPRVQTGGRNLIAEQFRNAGSRVVEAAAYETRCPDSIPKETIAAIFDRKIDAMIFSSGKTVSNSAFLLEKEFGSNWLTFLDQIKLLTIGPETSKICFSLFCSILCSFFPPFVFLTCQFGLHSDNFF